jgi:PST family polysaccharide transporter
MSKETLLMKSNNIDEKIISSTKWSFSSEIFAKIISPITNMILARLLSPEVFGIIATLSIIITFAEMLADSGLQKYMIQKDYQSDNERNQFLNVAFWTNTIFSFIIWGVIIVFNKQLAYMLGTPELGIALIVASFQIPLFGIASIQLSIFRREFQFKSYFFIRILTAIIPLLVTTPLAILGYGYWSLIYGTNISLIVSIILFFTFSAWRPIFFYSFSILKEMISFVVWTFLESLSIWITNWIDTIVLVWIISDQNLIGLFKNSVVAISGILSLFTSAVLPVLYSGLSRLKNDDEKFFKLLYDTQKYLAYILLPLGIGIYFYRDFVTLILLGQNWIDGAIIIGMWGVLTPITILFSHLISEAFRAKGNPKLSLLVQILHLVFLIPVIIIAAMDGYWTFIVIRSLVRLQLVVVSIIVFSRVFNQNLSIILTKLSKPFLLTVPMIMVTLVMEFTYKNIIPEIFLIMISGTTYIFSFIIFNHNEISKMYKAIRNKKT